MCGGVRLGMRSVCTCEVVRDWPCLCPLPWYLVTMMHARVDVAFRCVFRVVVTSSSRDEHLAVSSLATHPH